MENLEGLKKKLLKSKAIRKEYNRLDIAFEFGEAVIDFRVKYELTQENLSKITGIGLRTIKKIEQS